jgi:hypothetical protein
MPYLKNHEISKKTQKLQREPIVPARDSRLRYPIRILCVLDIKTVLQ